MMPLMGYTWSTHAVDVERMIYMEDSVALANAASLTWQMAMDFVSTFLRLHLDRSIF
jgi:hypothetical protein